MASLSVVQFLGMNGTWVHPGKPKATIQIMSDAKVQFEQLAPHGQAFAYGDSQCNEDFLLLIFDGSGKTIGASTLVHHLMHRITETVFRDTYGYQIIVFASPIPVSPSWKPPVHTLPDNFVQNTGFGMTFAWLHPGRDTQYVILGQVENQPRVIFCSRQDTKLVYCKPHGTWNYFESVLKCTECNDVKISSASLTSSMVCVSFHSSADANKLTTFYLASLTFDPSIYVVVARKHSFANTVHFHTDFEFGGNPKLHLHAVHI